ncbi:PD-(D/E)XK nuclease family protein [Spiroplasma endosymbiont of Diplazon laetatorius]|uniref:PD-(D/E)XK nuclease family protein n=1 Tax=Spiroplasma endosymbiont of Diplazon laetatorius TaxID=3066322 RepID=UPI0030D266DB
MIYDITDLIERDEKFNYLIKEGVQELPSDLNSFINGNKIELPFVSIILEECFPYLQNKFIKKEIIVNSMKQGECVHQIISDSIKERKEFKLNLVVKDCKNSNHLNIAKRIITELNAFIYKHDIDHVYSERTFVYLGYDCNYIGTVDIILKSKDTFYIMDVKTSRTNYVEKYNAQLFLYKKMFENASKKNVTDCFILNPREERVLMKHEKLSKQEQSRIISKIKEIKPIWQ